MKTTEDLADILSPPLKLSLADEVTVKLREAILTGRLQPGERLSENLLAHSMQVSRGPVREALSTLEREGLVIVRRNQGTFVARLSRQDLDEVYSLRRLLEPFAVQLAIQHGEPAHFQKMQAILDQMAAAIERGITGQESAELDLAFHTVIYQAARHKRLYDFWTDLQPQVHILLLSRTVANPDFRHSGVITDHQNILNAIRDKDEAQAVQLVVDHLQSSYARIIESYAEAKDSNGQV